MDAVTVTPFCGQPHNRDNESERKKTHNNNRDWKRGEKKNVDREMPAI